MRYRYRPLTDDHGLVGLVYQDETGRSGVYLRIPPLEARTPVPVRPGVDIDDLEPDDIRLETDHPGLGLGAVGHTPDLPIEKSLESVRAWNNWFRDKITALRNER